jgi:hypothetical protein
MKMKSIVVIDPGTGRHIVAGLVATQKDVEIYQLTGLNYEYAGDAVREAKVMDSKVRNGDGKTKSTAPTHQPVIK